jgi:predicted transcriptional regulator
MRKSMATPANTVRQKVHELADQLPANATWGDVRYQVELRASIERGLADSEAGRVTPHEEVVKEFAIAE